jgi:toxin-antitoxin system PIN domain toxin
VSHLLDVNFLVACGWQSHADHVRASRWLATVRAFATCPATEMGFLRVSLSPAFAASFADALAPLQAIAVIRGHRFVRDGTRARSLPAITSSKDVTDAHLVNLARAHRLKLATFDTTLCSKPWARGIAEDPTR